MSVQSNVSSPNKKAIKRLLKNKPAVFGLVIIALAILLAIFGYLLAPDDTPNANDQIPEVALVDPGFEIKMLKVRKNRTISPTNLFSHACNGTPGEYKMIPINTYRFEEDSLAVEVYRGVDKNGKLIPGTAANFSLADIAFSLASSTKEIPVNGSSLSIPTIGGDVENITLKNLQERIEKDHLVQKKFYLGTDKYGRDMLSRLILGVRISLIVGFIAVIISLTIGILLGALAGYFGGKTDDFIMLIINTIAAANFATAILIEAGLSYLGFGIQPPTPSWGNMLNENYGMAIGGKPLLALIPALAIMLMVLAFNLIGNGFRDALDVKTKL